MQVVFAIDKRFGGAVRGRDGHDGRHVLEVRVVFDLYFADASVRVSDLQDHRQLSGYRLKRIVNYQYIIVYDKRISGFFVFIYSLFR